MAVEGSPCPAKKFKFFLTYILVYVIVEAVCGPLIEYLNIFINDVLDYIYLVRDSCLLFIYYCMNYDIPIAIKSENLPRPIISKLSGKLFCGRQAGRQAACLTVYSKWL